MKPMFESSEVFEAYARIGLCYHGLCMIEKQLDKPLSPIERAVDNATGNIPGYDTAVSLLEEIISSKKIIEADYSSDAEMLNRIKQLKAKTIEL